MAKEGRPRMFETPENLMDAALDYFKWCDENPIEQEMIHPKNGVQTVKHKRPYTKFGLSEHLIVNYNTIWTNYKNFEEFIEVMARIEQIIINQQVSGAIVGSYKENLVARLNGYYDRTDITSGGEKIKLEINVIDQETKDLINKL